MSKINFDLVSLAQALVRCPSVTPKDEGALEVVENHLAAIDFKCTRLPFSEKNKYDVDCVISTNERISSRDAEQFLLCFNASRPNSSKTNNVPTL